MNSADKTAATEPQVGHLEARLRVLESARLLHAEQVADIVQIFRDLSTALPTRIGEEVRLGMCDLASDANIDRMVGKALLQVKKRAVEGAHETIWSILKSGFGRVMQVAGLLWLAWTIGGTPLVAKTWTWLTSP